MFRRITMHDFYKYFVVHSKHETLEAAAHAREVSGDLIIDDENKVVESDEWLFEWEKKDPKCYARKKQGTIVGECRIDWENEYALRQAKRKS